MVVMWMPKIEYEKEVRLAKEMHKSGISKYFLQIKVSFLHIRGRLETHNFHSLFMTNSCAIIDLKRYHGTVQNIVQ